MITVLVVGPRERTQDFDAAASRNPSIELLHAAELEGALDRLARNRRIDAVLLLVEAAPVAHIVETLLAEDPSLPPLFLPVLAGRLKNTIPVEGETSAQILEALASQL